MAAKARDRFDMNHLQSGRHSALFPIVAALITAFLITGCVVSRSPISGNKRAYGYTWQQEIELGTSADEQIVAQFGLYDDPSLTQYVDSVGQALLRISHLKRNGAEAEWVATRFHFRILDSPVINAFALPGGFVYVTRGILAHLESEAQLAVVLGHEIGHVAGRHASKRAAKQMGGNLVLLGAAVGGQILGGGDIAETILNVGGAATQLLFLQYGRDDERESDRLGVEYASMIGYDAGQASAFFRTLKRLGEQSESDIPSFLSTHPDPGAREETIQLLAADWAPQYETERIARGYYLTRVNDLIFGENPRNGFVRDDRFYHPELAFEFPVPQEYSLLNQAQQIVLTASDNKAAILMQIDQNHATAEEASEAFKAQEGINLVEGGIGTANGLSARYVLADATNSNGQELRLRAHFIDYDGTVFSFLGMALKENFGDYDAQFQSIMRGFRRLTDQQILSVQPDRIHLVQASQEASLQSVIPSTLPSGITPTGLAILNQLELGDTLPRGYTLKLVE